jgi:hypothetical protein
MVKKKVQIASNKKSERHFMIFHNETSKKDCLDYNIMEFIMLDESEFSVVVPDKTCAMGHSLVFLFFDSLSKVKKNGKKFPKSFKKADCIEVKGTVVDRNRIADKFIEIKIKPIGKYEDAYKQFISQFDMKQLEATKLFEKYKN